MTRALRPATGDAVRDYAAKLLAETREELTRADNKAATLFAAVGVAVAVVVGAVASTDVDVTELGTGWKVVVSAAAVLQSVGLVNLALALRPTTTKPQSGPLHYYGDVTRYLDTAGHPHVSKLREAAGLVASDPTERDLEQFGVLSLVVARKFRRIKAGLIASGLAAGVLGSSALLGLIW